MTIKFDKEKTWVEDEQGKEIAMLRHPKLSRNIVKIEYMYVDDSIFGQGASEKMMVMVVNRLKRRGERVELGCPYAIRWFAEHPEYDDIVVGVEE